MTQIVQAGQVNVLGLVVPDAVIQIVPPGNRPITGAPTNILGLVGTATWGPVGQPMPVGGNDQAAAIFGPMQNRANDLVTAVAVSVQQGASVMSCVRVTDGTDTAASIAVKDSGGSNNGVTYTSIYTGSQGNTAQVTHAPGSGASTTKVIVAMPNINPEVFDNISGGVVSNTVTAGTGATAVPALTFSAPQLPNGVQAKGNASLVTTGTPTVGAGGTGYVVGDTITLSNGVIVKVLTVSSGAILTFAAQGTSGTNVGSLTQGSAPTNPVAQVSTSGTGTGATVNLTWGLGPVTMTQQGSGYTSATCTVSSVGGTGTVTPVVTIWQNLVNAINNGQSGIRGPSQLVIASVGSSTTTPSTGTNTYALAGGSDGVANITSAMLIGQDTVPRKGMYALRGKGTSVVNIVDLADTTQWAAMLAFSLSEGTFVGTSTAVGDTITNAQSELSTAGVDGYGVKVIFGDWVYWNDPVNGVLRLLAPATFWAGMRAATTPQNSTLNAPLAGIVGTQKSMSGSSYSQADLQALISARLDVIANPAPGGSYFAMRSGNNVSSNPAVNGENYTMMTNFIAKSVGQWAGSVVGQLQSPTQRRQARSALQTFLNNLWSQGMIGNAQGTVPFQVVLDDSNNPPAMVSQGYEIANVKVQYLSVIRWFIVNVEGGQTVTVAVSPNAPPIVA